MFIEIHAIQSLPPSNPNRDKSGDIKSATYGGVLRSRMSSQSQKRAARQWYQQYSGIDRSQFAKRSRRWHEQLAPLLTWADEPLRDAMARIVISLFNGSDKKLFSNAYEMKSLLFLSQHEIETLAAIAEGHAELLQDLAQRLVKYMDREDVRKAHKEEGLKGDAPKSIDDVPSSAELRPLAKAVTTRLSAAVPGDVAVFGRMMANLTETSVDGSVQVAHALSVNSCPPKTPDKSWRVGEIDFFSAQDDIAPTRGDDASGAGMIGEVSFHAPVHYRYANIAAHEVEKLMADRDAAIASIKGFINGFIRSLPDGYSRQFAHQTMPEFVLLQVRRGCPYSLMSSFASPINGPGNDNDSISRQAVSRLMKQRAEMIRVYGDAPIAESIAAIDDHYPGGVNLDDAIAATLSACFSGKTAV